MMRVGFKNTAHALASPASADDARRVEPPVTRSGAIAFPFKGYVIMYGGLHGDVHLMNDVHVFDTQREHWVDMPFTPEPGNTPPPPSFGACSVVLRDGSLFILGGQSFMEHPLRCAHVLKPQSRTWQQMRLFAAHSPNYPADSPQGRAAREVCRWGGTMHAVNKRWWSKIIPLEMAKTEDVADCVLLFAGDTMDSKSDVLALWRCHKQLDRWTVKQVNAGHPEFLPRRRHVSAVYGDEFVFIFGGRCFHVSETFEATTEFTNDLWVYSIPANTWAPLTHATPPVLLQQLLAAAALHAEPAKAKELIRLQKAILTAMTPAAGRPVPQPPANVAWPERRTGASGMMVGDRFVVMTGFWFEPLGVGPDATRTFNDVWAFSLRTCRWEKLKENLDIPPGRLAVAEAEAGHCVGPYAHSMSAFTPLAVTTAPTPRLRVEDTYPKPPSTTTTTSTDAPEEDEAAAGAAKLSHKWTAFLSGGRAGDIAVGENFIVTIEGAPPVTLFECVQRHWVHRRLLQLYREADSPTLEEEAAEGHAKRRRKRPVNPKALRKLVNKAVADVSRQLPRRRKGPAIDDFCPSPSAAEPG
jgi:hypothetical protein